MSALLHKRLFIQKVEAFYTPFIEKYQKEKNRKYKKIHDRLPYRDLPLNRYLLDLPNFSQLLREDLIPNYLKKSKKAFLNALQVIKGECIHFENNMRLDQLLMEMAHLILL